ncbi:methyl-accepting chemotaxis protein [Aliarcobacter skirrowii]|nr:methyl-accepting chemotaxis protein [Aliarcobacter skirrowii]MDX4065218.1 methyl-accepting chemotaxis protein [Aliarcobacter skirrowii]
MFINNLKVNTKINIISLVAIILLSSVAIILYKGMSNINKAYESNSQILNLAITITKTSEQGLQVSNALRGIIINPSDTKAKENFINAVRLFDELINQLENSSNISQGFNRFNIKDLYTSQANVLNAIQEKLKNGIDLTKEDNTESTKQWRPLKAALLKWEERNIERNIELTNEFKNIMSSTINFIESILIITILSILIIIQLISRNIVKNIRTFQNGLVNFFKFSNKESNTVQLINIDSNDEFGTMAKVINENIKKTQNLLIQDESLINDVKKVVEDVLNGYLNKRIQKSTTNESLEELKNNFNSMLEVIQKNVCSDINKVVKVLDSFSKLDFRSKIDNDNGKVAIGINNLANIITNMLVENKSNGITLQESSNFLLSNVNKLNISSNEAAASLEETAAALEEITSNIRNNTQSIAKMSQLANGVTKAVTDGQEMANQTTTAMDEINTQVNLVNEAIGVIDNIAFQTNILSLNAAVEAATAGEAGKGFAVVAQEVRNLATRSAEAAKEIKEIVERATVKANEGKSIATNMIEGYKNLNNNISSTMNLIADIENASKEQLLGIEQINDAVNQLDQQTQQNAMVASQSHDIALGTDEIAKLIVEDANQKEFEGKNEVKAKDIGLKKEVKENIIKSSPKVLTKKIVKKDSKEIDKDSTWESF